MLAFVTYTDEAIVCSSALTFGLEKLFFSNLVQGLQEAKRMYVESNSVSQVKLTILLSKFFFADHDGCHCQ